MNDYFEEYEKRINNAPYRHLASVWAFVLIARAIADLADAVRYRTTYTGNFSATYDPSLTTFGDSFDYDGTQSPREIICPYCAQSLSTGGLCGNPNCPGKK